jgi:hypothetical protein
MYKSDALFFSYNVWPRCGNSSVGRARPCQGRGREFESRFPLQNFYFSPFSLLTVDVKCCHNSKVQQHLNAGIAQLVEHDLAKVGVASSSLVSRSKIFIQFYFNYPQLRHALCRALHTMY